MYLDHNNVRIGKNGWRDINDILRPFSLLEQLTEEELTEIGVTKVPPTQPELPQENIDLLKSMKWEQIKQERDRRTQEGGYRVGTKWYHSDTFSRTQQMGLVMLGANIPPGLQWKTMDGTFITMTPTLAQQIFGAGAMQDTLTFANAEAHRLAVFSLTDIQAVKDYDISTGWPEIFNIVE